MRTWPGLAAVLALAVAVAGASALSEPTPNLLLVTIDTLRADRVGAYGCRGCATPALDGLARGGVLVEDAVVQVPQTRPSHASIFTGRQPYEHGLRDNYSAPLPAGTPTLASLLRARGWDTAAFIGAYPVSRASGLAQGFATFDDPFGAGESAGLREARIERPASEVVDGALEWLARPRRGPFFGWVHLFDPHTPYAAPAPFKARFAKRPYDGEVAYADSQLARLLGRLEQSGQRGRTLVVVTSDHGEALGEHGEEEHMVLVYDSTLRVPLLFSWPGRLPAGVRVAGQFRSVDLLPTILELMGQAESPASGASRAAHVRGGARIPDNESYAESLYGSLHFGWAPLRALRAEGWKYIDAPRPELYRLPDDPRELSNLVDLRGSVAAAIKARLATYDRGAATPPPSAPIDPGAAERLAALGYVGGSFFRGAPSGADPKDKIREFEGYRREMVRGIALYRRGELDAAIKVLEPLARRSRISFNVDYHLGLSLLAKDRHAEAMAPLRRAVEQAPTAGPAHVAIVRAAMGAGRLDDARAALERGLAVGPSNPELHHLRGRLLLRADDLAGARVALEKARELVPSDAAVRADLSNAYRNLGDISAALREAEEAARLDPKSADAQVALGLALGAVGRESEAAQRLREAVRLQARHPDALFYLGAVELRAGRPGTAVPLLERLIGIAPDYPGAAEILAAARKAAGGPAPR